ncbi:MAG TPA: gephyrin-like molybdotransferase Glp [Pirellulales bacterium]
MITVAEALAHVRDRAKANPARQVPLAAALGLVLADDVASDIDSPPYDKSIVDGYAVIADDLRGGKAHLTILEEVVAGAVPTARVVPGTATRIMTGAPLPAGANAVVMIERTEVVRTDIKRDELPRHEIKHHDESPLGQVVICDAGIGVGRNILRRGTAMRTGDMVLRRGVRLRPSEIGLLAEVGRAVVTVVPRPTVAILATGNELVEPNEIPSAGQIRNSNGPLLAALVSQAGGDPIVLPVARDDEADLREKISAGLAHDMLVLSGGVSAGVLDLVPRVLAELGAQQIFHKVRLKPGKPLWFGIAPRGDRRTLIFGLPGNPVSSFVCSELFMRPAIEQLAGREGAGLRRVRARLEAEHAQRGDRQTYLPGVLCTSRDAQPGVRLVDWQGSADLRGLAAATVLIEFAPGERQYAAGELVDILLLEGA